MKRLTNHNPGYQPYVISANKPTWIEIYDKLCAYEDTGLEPEEIKEICTDDVAEVARIFRKMIQSGEIDHLTELLKADAEGRLLILPCKVGDTVYVLKNVVSRGYPDPIITKRVFEKHFTYEDLNYAKATFPTREEAEDALREVDKNV